jgi:hypothetical protein
MNVIRAITPPFWKAVIMRGRRVPRRCYSNMAQATTTASIKTFMAISLFPCRSQSCFRNPEKTSRAVNLF